MVTVFAPQTDFSAGEIAPEALARIDIAQYRKSAKNIRDALLKPRGGTFRRPGLEFIDNLGALTAVKKLEFRFSKTQTYLFVLSHEQVEIFNNGVSVSTEVLPYETADLNEIRWTQAADTIIFFHEDYEPRTIVRGATHSDWTVDTWDVDSIPKHAFTLAVSNPAQTLTPSATSGNITLTAGGSVFASTDVGGYISGGGGEAKITKYISATVVEAYVILDFINTSAISSGQWELENGYEDVWSSTRGWPRTGCFFKNRLFIGGSRSRPSTVWGSVLNDFFNFNLGTGLDRDAVEDTPNTGEFNTIRAMVASDTLQVFTNAEEFAIPVIGNEGITPANFKFVQMDNRGISDIRPIILDGATLFHQEGSNLIREFVYDDLSQKFKSNSISVFSSHVINNPIEMGRDKPSLSDDYDRLYVVNNDGSWAVLHSMRSQELSSWTGGSTDLGEVIDMAWEGSYLYVSLIDSETDDLLLCRFNYEHRLDGSIIDTAMSPTDTWTGLGHLEGRTVAVWGDDGYFDGFHVVDSGGITTNSSYSKTEIGVNYVPTIILNPVEKELPDGPMSGRIRRVVSVILKFNGVTNAYVNGVPINFHQFGEDVFGSPLTPFVGDKRVFLPGYSRNPEVIITQPEPGEFQLLGAVQEVKI